MSADKQGTVKSELSPDGGLKLTIKREKTVDDACEPEWVTEARGDGLGKFVIKRRSPGSVSRSTKTTGLHVDRQAEQRPILRLSLTSSASSDGNRHAQVKSWSFCEVPPPVEDVASVSEMSPACQLQPSPKDSGIDISSPPHDDGAVGVEPNAGTGIWSAGDCHTGDSSAVEVEEKLEAAVTGSSLAHPSSSLHADSKPFWLDTASDSTESNEPKVQSTLRSRDKRSNLKSFASNSQKLVNPLAKTHRVGRYQHMLPVHRIRAESNIARRSSLEESPTYNMVTSRTSLFSHLPRVKTKLKLLSNNTYAPVFDQETDVKNQHVAGQENRCLNVERSASVVVEHRRNRVSCQSFKNMKVKFGFSSKRCRTTLEDDGVQKIPKLKLVVKSKPELTVSCVEERLEDVPVTATVKRTEEKVSSRVRRKQRHLEVQKLKDCSAGNSASVDSYSPTDSSNACNLPSCKAADTRSSHPKRKSSKADRVAETSEKKSKLQSCTEQHSSHITELFETQQSFKEDRIHDSVQSTHVEVSSDEAVCDVVEYLTSISTDQLCVGQSSVLDGSNKGITADKEEAVKHGYSSVDQTQSSTSPTELHCNGTGAIHKRKSSKADRVAETSEKKSKLQSSTAQHSSHITELFETQQSFKEDRICDNVQSTHVEVSSDEAVCGVVEYLTSISTDQLCVGQSGVLDGSNNGMTADKEEAVKHGYSSVDQTQSSTSSAEWHCNGTGAIHSGSTAIDEEECGTEVSDFESDKCAVSCLLTVNTDNSSSGVDSQHEGKFSLPDDSVGTAKEQMAVSVQHNDTGGCTATSGKEGLIADMPCVMTDSISAGDRLTKEMLGDQSGKSDHTSVVFDEDSMADQSSAVCTDTIIPVLSSPVLVTDDSVVSKSSISVNYSSTLLQNSSGSHTNQDNNLSVTMKPAVIEDHVSCDFVLSQNSNDVVNNLCSVDSAKLDCQDAEHQQDIKQQMSESTEFCEKSVELISVCSVSDQDQKCGNDCEEIDSKTAFSFDIPSHIMPSPASYHSKEHKEAHIPNSVCSNGFLAAFTQFVEKVSVEKTCASCKVIETASASKSLKELPLKTSSSQKCVRRRSSAHQRQRLPCLEKQTLPDRIPHPVDHCQATGNVDCVSSKEPSLLETSSAEEIYCSERLNGIELSTLSRDELLNIVTSHRHLVTLRHRVCELLETLLPEVEFPAGFRRDSAAVERFVNDILDILSNGETQMQGIQQCSEPVVTLHHMPDRCLQALQQQVIRLLSLLLPDTDLSDVNVETLDVFLELMTSANRPSLGVFSVSQPNLHIRQDANLQPLDKLQVQHHLSTPCHVETDLRYDQTDTSLSRTESHGSVVDALCSMPSSLLPINTQCPINDKRSIRRQVKDCLMFLDRDLT